jgi:serine/threonine protein kinase
MGCGNSNLPQSDSIDIDGWRVLDKLGRGSYADVFAVKCKGSSQCAAVKIPRGTCKVDETKLEIKVWKQIGKHENIVNLIQDVVVEGRRVMLMEKCECSLASMIGTKMSEAATSRMFRQMTSAIAHLESLSIVHRDVKPDNFLLAKGDRIDQILKLCDFGFARKMPTSGKLFGKFGSPVYMSPEMIGDGPHNLKTDVWSLGVTCYVMLYRDYPYIVYPLEAKGVMQAIASGAQEPKYEGFGVISHAAKEAVAAMLHRPVTSRITASKALELPFLTVAHELWLEKASAKESEAIEIASQSTGDVGFDSGLQISYSGTEISYSASGKCSSSVTSRASELCTSSTKSPAKRQQKIRL